MKNMGLQCIPITTIHDSIVVDTSKELCYNIGIVLKECVEDVPNNFKRLFGIEFNLPLTAEIKAGDDLRNMEKIA